MAKAKRKKRKLQQGTRDYAAPRGKVTLQGMDGPVAASQWDMGPSTALQQQRKVVEPLTYLDERTGTIRKNPNGVKRARKISVAELYFKRRQINERQFTIAEEFLAAHEFIQRGGGDGYNPKVDARSGGVCLNAEKIDAGRKYFTMRKHATVHRKQVMAVAHDDEEIDADDMDKLREGLDHLADMMEGKNEKRV